MGLAKRLNTIWRYLKRDIVDLGVLGLTIAASVWMFAENIILFGWLFGMYTMYIFRGIMWMGQTIDVNQELMRKLVEQEYINQDLITNGTK